MKNYRVDIDYKSGPSFSIDLESDSMSQVKLDAREMAKLSGFVDQVKKITAREIA